MSPPHRIGLLGYGRICRALAGYVDRDPAFELAYVHVRSPRNDLPSDVQVTDVTELPHRSADLVIEGAAPEAVPDLAEAVLPAADLVLLSGSALADPEVEVRLDRLAADHASAVYLPHAALLGIDGLVDARSELRSVEIEARKAPSHLDFAYTDEWDEADVTEPTVLYEGPVRGLCRTFPRNFNSHAAVALASLGLDDTRSRLVADPEADSALHVVSASGDGFDLEITRDSAIEGVTGDYTLVSIWGSIRRILHADDGVRFV
ncbi:aspartate dehydrogenase domain-containing protein [Halorarum halobium]|uniref:aspartate dehydrogenase domain-containing protein n=1 Tax=Halorarum halobium TaxID=3075121 RepID=UPI0028AA4580|nr:aspartate dehydrogenase domain-containing protein [Halobaculum sp. XH14]